MILILNENHIWFEECQKGYFVIQCTICSVLCTPVFSFMMQIYLNVNWKVLISKINVYAEPRRKLMIQLFNCDLVQSLRLMKHETVNNLIIPNIIICKFNEIRSLIPECITFLLMQSTATIQMVEISFKHFACQSTCFSFFFSRYFD